MCYNEFHVVHNEHNVPPTHAACMCACADQHHAKHETCWMRTLTLAHRAHQTASWYLQYYVVNKETEGGDQRRSWPTNAISAEGCTMQSARHWPNNNMAVLYAHVANQFMTNNVSGWRSNNLQCLPGVWCFWYGWICQCWPSLQTA